MNKRLASLATATALAASALLVAPLTACTSNTHVCTEKGCDVSLSGKGSSTEIGTGKAKITLTEASNGTAKIVVGQAGERTCAQGQTLDLNDAKVTCKEIGNNSVKLRIDYV